MYAPYYNGSNTVTATYTTNTEYVINGVSGTYLSVYPRLLAAGSKLVVEAATEGYVIKKEIVLSNEIDLETGKITTLNVNLSDEHITAAATGLSLPFTDDFSDLTGNSATNILSRKDKNGNNLYVANSYVYQYNSPHGLRMSSSDNSGYIVTSELDLSAPFSVLISAKVWPKGYFRNQSNRRRIRGNHDRRPDRGVQNLPAEIRRTKFENENQDRALRRKRKNNYRKHTDRSRP